MKLYHISTDLQHNGFFTPRIPHLCLADENRTTERVCASSSVDGCLSAIPDGGSRLEEYDENREPVFLLFEIDTEELGVSQEDIVSPGQLYEREWVVDAEETGEHWILKPFLVPESSRKLIRILDWDEEVYDLVPKYIYDLSETEEYGGDYEQAYLDSFGARMPCAIKIANCEYEEVSGQKS